MPEVFFLFLWLWIKFSDSEESVAIYWSMQKKDKDLSWIKDFSHERVSYYRFYQ